MIRCLILVVALLGVAGCGSTPAPAPPLRVYSSNGVRAWLEAAEPALARATGRTLAFEFSTAAGLRRRIDAGDVPDVAVLTTAIVDDLIAQRRLAADTRREVARVGVGIGVAAGAPKADVSTPDAVKTLLLDARAITFTAEGQSRAAIDRAFATLGIADRLAPKLLLKGPGEPAGVVARGEADVVLTLSSELIGVPGITLLGPFPAALQQHVIFTAARSATASPSDAAAADLLLQTFAASDVVATLADHGLEPPIPPR